MKTMKLLLTMALLTACTIGVHAQTWYLIGYDKQGNVVKNGGVPAVIDIQQDFGYLLSSLGNSASYFSIMRKNGEGLWFTEVYKAKFQLDGGVVTQIESTPSVMPTIAVGDDHIVISGCKSGDEIVLLTTDGRVVFRRKAPEERFLVDTSRFTKGIYLLRAAQTTQKFLKR
ncbi:MAG: hypothetical protein IKH99_06565 [Prevotella sp.]|nr:hypothetical protein [Prevotella sp.]